MSENVWHCYLKSKRLRTSFVVPMVYICWKGYQHFWERLLADIHGEEGERRCSHWGISIGESKSKINLPFSYGHADWSDLLSYDLREVSPCPSEPPRGELNVHSLDPERVLIGQFTEEGRTNEYILLVQHTCPRTPAHIAGRQGGQSIHYEQMAPIEILVPSGNLFDKAKSSV